MLWLFNLILNFNDSEDEHVQSSCSCGWILQAWRKWIHAGEWNLYTCHRARNKGKISRNKISHTNFANIKCTVLPIMLQILNECQISFGTLCRLWWIHSHPGIRTNWQLLSRNVPSYIGKTRVSDPHWFNADPDTDPDPAFFLIADPDSGSGFRIPDPDPDPWSGSWSWIRIQGLMT